MVYQASNLLHATVKGEVVFVTLRNEDGWLVTGPNESSSSGDKDGVILSFLETAERSDDAASWKGLDGDSRFNGMVACA